MRRLHARLRLPELRERHADAGFRRVQLRPGLVDFRFIRRGILLGGIQIRFRLLSRSLRAVKFLLRNRVFLPQFLAALNKRKRT